MFITFLQSYISPHVGVYILLYFTALPYYYILLSLIRV